MGGEGGEGGWGWGWGGGRGRLLRVWILIVSWII
jgi:hypothetical protein